MIMILVASAASVLHIGLSVISRIAKLDAAVIYAFLVVAHVWMATAFILASGAIK